MRSSVLVHQCLHWFSFGWGRKEGGSSVEKVFRLLLLGRGVLSDTVPPSHPQPAAAGAASHLKLNHRRRRAEGEGQAPWGLMAGGRRNGHWVLCWLSALLTVERVSGASGLYTGAHTSPFPASGVKQIPVVDVSIQAESWHQVGVNSSKQQMFIGHLLCARH